MAEDKNIDSKSPLASDFKKEMESVSESPCQMLSDVSLSPTDIMKETESALKNLNQVPTALSPLPMDTIKETESALESSCPVPSILSPLPKNIKKETESTAQSSSQVPKILSPTPTDTIIETVAVPESDKRMLKIATETGSITKREVEDLLKNHANIDINKSVEDIKIKCFNRRATGLVTFKNTRLAAKTLVMLRNVPDRIISVKIGNYHPTTGERMFFGRKENRCCFVCGDPLHVILQCPFVKDEAQGNGDAATSNATGNTKNESILTDNKKESESEQGNSGRMLMFIKLPQSWSREETEDYLENNVYAGIKKDIEDFSTHEGETFRGNTARRTCVTFKTVKAAEKAMLLCGINIPYMVNIGTFDPKTGFRISENSSNGRTTLELKNICYVCGSSTHIASQCKWTAMRRAAKRPATEALAPQNGKLEKRNVFTPDLKVLRLIKVPVTWTRANVSAYIKQRTNKEIFSALKFIYMVMLGRTSSRVFSGKCYAMFESHELCSAARVMLNNGAPLIYGKRIYASFDTNKNHIWRTDNKPDFMAMKARRGMQKDNRLNFMAVNNERTKLKVISWQENPNQNNHSQIQNQSQSESSVFSNVFHNIERGSNTYGLSADILKSLGITPPLTSRIVVNNMPMEYDDEALIRELFSHAGAVVSVAILSREDGGLRLSVEFDHPLEAVQAISLLHNQEVYSKTIQIHIDRTPKTKALPPGLKTFGKGFGKDGLPLKNVRGAFELLNAVNSIMKEINALKISENEKSSKSQADNSVSSNTAQFLNTSTPVNNAPDINVQNVLADLVTGLSNSANNPLLALGTLLNPQCTQILQLLNQQNAASNHQEGPIPQMRLDQPPPPLNSWNVGQPIADWQNTAMFNCSVPGAMQSNIPPEPNIVWVPNVHDQNIQPNIPNSTWQGIPGILSQNYHGTSMPAQNMQALFNNQGIPNTQSMPNVQNQNYQAVPNLQNQNILSPNYHGVPNMQAQNIQNLPNQQGIPNIQNIPNVQNQNYHGVPNIQAQNIQNLPNPQGIPNIQNIPNVQNQNYHGVPNIQAQNIQSLPNPQGIPNIQHIPNVQSQNIKGKTQVEYTNKQVTTDMQNTSKSQDVVNIQSAPNAHGQTLTTDNIKTKEPNAPHSNIHGIPRVIIPKSMEDKTNRPSIGSNMKFGKKSKSGSHKESTLNSQGKSHYQDDADKSRVRDDCSVRFKHLPPSVTETALKSKMREIGEVRSVALIGPGRARVSFYSPRDAKLCVDILDQTKVDGQVIDVDYL